MFAEIYMSNKESSLGKLKKRSSLYLQWHDIGSLFGKSNVRVSHVNEHLSFVYIMLNEDWIIATRMLNDTFQQTLLDK